LEAEQESSGGSPIMLDVHVPHKSLHGFWEFFVHLFTISVGLLIATQIESCVEWRHHVHMAAEARQELRTEIEHNVKDLQQLQPGMKKWREQIDADLEVVQRIQDHPNDPKAQHPSLTINASGITLDDTAWRTAQSTGALAYMPYEEAERYAGIYQTQESLLAFQDKPLEDVAGIMGLIAKYRQLKMTREQASNLAEKLGQMELHLSYGDTLLQAAVENGQAFLEHREPKRKFSEAIR
jgi:hypothetical protein